MSYKTTSLANLLIATLSNGRSTRHFYTIIRELELKKQQEASARVALSRLHHRGLINKSIDGWSVTSKGRKYSNKTKLLIYSPSPFTKSSPKNTIISFDIPESSRLKRNWLRNQLKIFNYEMIHQSLWFGPGPLPVRFYKKLEKLDIRKNIKVFSKVKKKN